MDILKPTRETIGESKHIGGEIPPVLHSYLLLYCTAKGISKSQGIREALLLWESHNETEDQLMESIVITLKNNWKAMRSTKAPFNKFIKKAMKALNQKGIGILCIEKIINQIKE